VGEIEPDRLAARVGLAPGDLVVALDGAPVTSIAELSILVRGPVRTGAEAEVRWLRGTELLAGAATV
jgi:S1-C subfamily serine protease